VAYFRIRNSACRQVLPFKLNVEAMQGLNDALSAQFFERVLS
jgi:hypothetical protein